MEARVPKKTVRADGIHLQHTQQVVAHGNTAKNTVFSGHVRRAPYLLQYFCRSL